MPERRGGESRCQPWEPLRSAEGRPRLSPLSPLCLPNASGRGQRYGRRRSPLIPVGLLPAHLIPESPGARASLMHVQPRQAGLRARAFCSHVTAIISAGNCPRHPHPPPAPPRSPVPWTGRAGDILQLHPQTHFCPASASAAPPRVRFTGPKGALKGGGWT